MATNLNRSHLRAHFTYSRSRLYSLFFLHEQHLVTAERKNSRLTWGNLKQNQAAICLDWLGWQRKKDGGRETQRSIITTITTIIIIEIWLVIIIAITTGPCPWTIPAPSWKFPQIKWTNPVKKPNQTIKTTTTSSRVSSTDVDPQNKLTIHETWMSTDSTEISEQWSFNKYFQ